MGLIERAHLDGLKLLEGLEVGSNVGQGGAAGVNLAPELCVQRLTIGRRARRLVLLLQLGEVQLEAARRVCPLVIYTPTTRLKHESDVFTGQICACNDQLAMPPARGQLCSNELPQISQRRGANIRAAPSSAPSSASSCSLSSSSSSPDCTRSPLRGSATCSAQQCISAQTR